LLNTFKNTKDIQSLLKKRGYKPFIKFFLFLFPFNFTLLTFNCVAQNLVFNGDFEIYDTCPASGSTPGNLEIERCTGWTAPTKLGTSDYFNACSINFINSVPQNFFGYQQPYSGNGYCGFFAWAIDINNNSNSYREYLQTQLQQPLIAGKEYHFSFFVSYYGVNYSVEKIGALFSSNNFNGNNYSPIVATPQIVYSNGIITDSLGWTKIEGNFIANGGEQFLTIGYFEDSLAVFDTLNTHNEEFIFPESYYYIDGVELIDITQIDTVQLEEILIPNVFTPNNDGNNDLFYLNFTFEKVEIYNRWGQKLFESNNNESFWDGRTTSGNEIPDGTYYYIITTEEKVYKGFIQLLR